MTAPHDVALGVLLDYIGVSAFAVTGALAASLRTNNLLSFGFFALATGLSGGALRDLLIGAPVFWVRDAGYVAVCVAAAGAAWAVGLRSWPASAGLWLDALGLCALSVAGASKAAAYGEPPLSSVVIGVLAAVVGGIVRDLLSREPLMALSREPSVAAAGAGAGAFVILRVVGAPGASATAIALAAAFALCAFRLRRRQLITPPSPSESV